MKYNRTIMMPMIVIYVVCVFAIASSNAEVVSGSVDQWLESSSVLALDDHLTVTSGIQASWSVAGSNSGWFYGFNDLTSVAVVAGETIDSVNAATYSYQQWYDGPVYEGDLVLFNNASTGYYAALYIDDIYGSLGEFGGAYATYLDGTWYFQSDGTGVFSTSAVPIPGTFLLFGTGLVGLTSIHGRRIYKNSK